MKNLDQLDQRYQDLTATTDAARYLALKGWYGTSSDAAVILDEFQRRYPRSAYTLSRKAAVPPLDTTTGGALLPPSTDPILAVMQREILPARIGVKKAPFNVPTPVQSSLGTYHWVLENQPKPATNIDWTSVTNPVGKISGIVPVSKELTKLTPGAEGVFASALIGGAVSFADRQFLDPAVGLISPGRPASITNGVVPITATGTTLAEQVDELIAALYAGRPQTQRPVVIAAPAVAQTLARHAPTAASGTFGIVQVVPSPEAGSLVVALDATGIVYSDGGGEIDRSEQAAIESNDAPIGGALAVITSLWQTNLVGYRVERMLWWQKVDANVVQVLTVS